MLDSAHGHSSRHYDNAPTLECDREGIEKALHQFTQEKLDNKSIQSTSCKSKKEIKGEKYGYIKKFKPQING